MAYKNLHATVLKRLSLAWLLLTLILGSVVLYLQTEQIDELVIDLAVKESSIFTADDFVSARRDNLSIMQQKTDALIQTHFVIVELYDKHQRQLLGKQRPDADKVEHEIDKTRHAFPATHSFYYRKLLLDNHLYLLVILPVKAQGRLVGYFEGVYRVDDKTQEGIINNLVSILALVVLIILATTVTLYPIIIHLNKGLIKFSIEQLRGNIELLNVLGGAIAKRDSDTNAHNYRVTLYSIQIAETLGLDSRQIRNLTAGAFLHDVGKIGIIDSA